MCEKLPIDNFKRETDLSIFTSDFIKNYNSHGDMGYIFYVDITYPKELYELHKDLPFLPDRMEVNQVNKLVANVYDKANCYTYLCIKTSFKSWFNIKKGTCCY